MIITVSGLVGSGKTTVARKIAEKLRLRYISAGEVFRQMASEQGVSLEKFSELAERNHSFDREVDRRQNELVGKGNAVVDGRLSGWLFEADLKIWLKASLEVRARRVAEREKKSFSQALEETKKREKSEVKRYHDIYRIDLYDLSPYDLVINTGLWGAEEIAHMINVLVSSRAWQ